MSWEPDSSREDRLLNVFKAVHGELSRGCHAEVVHNNDDVRTPLGVACMKDGRVAWIARIEDLTFDYMTMNDAMVNPDFLE